MSDVTQLLSAIDQGDPQAASQLLPLVYDALRRLAAQKMANERPGQTLNATGLVHEAFMRLVAETIGHAACVLGAGRERAEDRVDPAVGIVMPVRVEDAVKAGDTLAEMHYRDEAKCVKARQMIQAAFTIADSRPLAGDLIYEVID